MTVTDRTVVEGELDTRLAGCVDEDGYDDMLELLGIPAEHAHWLDANTVREADDGLGYGAIKVD
jgi:hypothetical protein